MTAANQQTGNSEASPGETRAGAARSATVKDVATLAGVSPKTVSNVINGFAHVAPATRERVQRAIRQLGYRPNRAARNLRRGSTGMIALVLPELDVPYFAELGRHFLTTAEEHGRTLLIEQTLGDRDREVSVINGLGDHIVDGVVVSPLALHGHALAGHLGAVPLVLIGERPSGGLTDHVVIDNVAAAREAVTHLIRGGRRRIAAVGPQPEPYIGTPLLRRTGYRQALEAAGLPLDPRLERETPRYHLREGARAMDALLDGAELPDAVFCFNDALALGALRTLYERGLRVPEDVAVMGFDDIEATRYSTPSLSTVAPDKGAIARHAVSLLLERIDAPGRPPREVVVGHTLCTRESTEAGAAYGDGH
ncbi:LacI family DNA-binding transcriptional regulator [Streptomyces botrytidirepellens]|uniref:LacI family transcriptional regulator n=1 Tax=Streptomyces botrytidirepellens TaxID=2486417 RepID=A0A3M8VNJ7_9ACTN|nr:LacI family DNA-binding transcriptional regulator [Streptomyces botrytidirepellens]RNG18015.1 LacI family transcriptional regulator [Streptomyces botrytidirepellens]